MPNVVIERNTYPDDQSMKRVLHYILDKAVAVGGYGVNPNVEAAYLQMQFVKQAFYQTDALQLKHFFITYSHEESIFIDFDEMLQTAFEAAKRCLHLYTPKRKIPTVYPPFREERLWGFSMTHCKIFLFLNYISETASFCCGLYFADLSQRGLPQRAAGSMTIRPEPFTVE